MEQARQAVVIFSGGMDSGTLAYLLAHEGYIVHLMSFHYGQKHAVELEWAALFWDRMRNKYPGTSMRQLDVSWMGRAIMGGSSQTDPSIPVPEGHYADATMKATVVPNRNMVMLSMAGAYAISIKAEVLGYGAHGGDHEIYPDCRPPFVSAMAEAFVRCDWHKLKLHAPFLRKTKADIARIGTQLGVPYNLTWSCYNGKVHHCGKCGTCVERKEAFREAGLTDPTTYENPPPF